MATDTGYAKRDYLRVCDICGHRWHRSKLKPIGEMRLACPDDYKGLTAEQISRHNANARPLVVKAVKNPKPDGFVDIYQQAEARIFNLLVNEPVTYPDVSRYEDPHYVSAGFATAYAAGRLRGTRRGVAPQDQWQISGARGAPLGEEQSPEDDGTDPAEATIMSAAETMRYLYELIVDDRRPRQWIRDSTRKFTELADFLLTRQFGSPSANAYLSGAAATTARYGGFSHYPDNVIQPHSDSAGIGDVAAGLYALTRAAQILGTPKYIQGARRCATFLRRAQCCDLTTNFWSTNGDPSVASPRFHYGAFPQELVVVHPAETEVYHLFMFVGENMHALEALALLRAVDGDATYGDAAAVGIFSFATAATLSTMIDECRAFWRDGAYDLEKEVHVIGFSSATPRGYFEAAQAATSDKPQWAEHRSMFATTAPYPWFFDAQDDFCKALRSLFEVEGFSAQVEDVYGFLRSIVVTGSGVPAGVNPHSCLAKKRNWGTYDAAMGVPRATIVLADSTGTPQRLAAGHGADDPTFVSYDPRAEVDLNNMYQPISFGYLAAIQAERDPAGFKRAKDKWTRAVPVTPVGCQDIGLPPWKGISRALQDDGLLNWPGGQGYGLVDPMGLEHVGYNFSVFCRLDGSNTPLRAYRVFQMAVNAVAYRLNPQTYPELRGN